MSEFARAEVRPHHGVPTLFVDGHPLHGMTATSCAFDDPQVVRDFARSGVEIMMIWIEIAIRCWRGPGKYDWSYAEEKLRFFEEHAADRKWIIRVRLGLVDRWFAEAFPGEVHDPPRPGEEPERTFVAAVIHSSVWRAQIERLLRDFVRWLRTTRYAPRIIGFMLNAGSTEEWLPFDVAKLTQGQYHPVYRREFQAWLRRRYADDVKALRRAWDDREATFEKAAPPAGFLRKGSHIFGPYSLRDPRRERPATDYYRFLNETLADELIVFCRTAKEAAGSPIIAGGFHSYLWWESGVYSYIQEYGHGLIQRLNESPWVDFVSDIASYDCRYPGGTSGYLGLPHSLNLHGKLHYTEVDLVTIHSLPRAHRRAWKKADTSRIPPRTAAPVIPDPLWTWNCNYCGRDEEEQTAILQREHAHNLITGTPYWWFDIRSHDYQEPFIVRTLQRLSDLGRRSVEWDRRSASEVAFVLSEETPFGQAAMNGEMIRFELECQHRLLIDLASRQWGLAGVPYDRYELRDLAHPSFPGEQYKLLIFVNCAVVPPQAVEGVRRWQRDGRVFCWTYAPAVLSEQRLDPRQAEKLIGMRLGWRNERQNIRVLMEGKHALTRGGAKLDFGTEGSVGPVFFADDPKAKVLGRLRDGGEAAFAVREHRNWRSVYLAMLNFGPQLLRNLASYAGAHVWCESDDVVYANRSLLCLHTATGGAKKIRLPRPAMVTDVWSGERSAKPVREIRVRLPHYRTRIWRTDYQG
jgi:hypothetical protein